MPKVDDMSYRSSAIFPFLLSILSFALVFLLVLSGTNPDLIPDGYLLSLNTTDVGQNLVQFNSASANSSAIVTRNVVSISSSKRLRALSKRTSRLLDLNTTSSAPQTSNGTFSSSQSLNSTSSTSDSLNSTSQTPQSSNGTLPSSQSLNSTSSAANSLNSTSQTPQSLNGTFSSSQSLNSTSPTADSLNSTSGSTTSTSPSAAPVLSIPSSTPAPGALPTITVPILGALFQVVLNSLASGVGDNLKSIVTLAVSSQKQSLGVTQTYNLHLLNICQGSVATGANLPSTANPLNITRCVTYTNASDIITNLTSTVTASTIIAATNITIPVLNEVPGLGKSAKGMVDTVAGLIFILFIVNLVGSGLSILLSVAAFFSPSNSTVHSAAAAITTISTMILQTAAFTSTFIATGVSSSINKFSYTLGLRATVGSKFLIFMWVGYITAQAANSYWMTTWFVEYRKRSYKARERTPQEIGDYKNIRKEILSDLRLRKVRYDYPRDIKQL